MKGLRQLFERHFGFPAASVEPLTGSASHRRYYRLSGSGVSVIGVEGTDERENRAFIALSAHFASKGLPVPRVLESEGLDYLQEDLGGTILYDVAVSGGNFDLELLHKTVAALPRLQFEGAEGLPWEVCYPQEEFDARMIDFDLNYFKYDFLKLTGAEFDETLLQDDFDRLREDLLTEKWDTFLYRDFNSRNVMVRDGEPWFIDFQGGRRGPIYYDLASFVWQARAKFPPELRKALVDTYFQAASRYRKMDRGEFDRRLRLFVLFRQLQVLGCYGFRGLWEGKEAFASSIPLALANIRELLPFNEYPYLTKVLGDVESALSSKPVAARGSMNGRGPFMGGTNMLSASASLTVTVYSFSFKKGIPEDESGNGGGYVFDCRCTHNPGKYEQFKQMTGMDAPVIEFLEKDGEILSFLQSVYALVDHHVERFLERGFTHLQVSFGCTGGQHRSVFCAERLASRLKEKYGVWVHLVHRERQIEKYL